MYGRQVLDLDECVPGLIVAEDIYKGASLVVPKNVPIDDYLISRLRAFGIDQIALYLPRGFVKQEKKKPLPKPVADPDFAEEYQENLTSVKTVLHDLAAGRELELAKMETVFSSVFEQVSDNYSLIECINEMRQVDEYTYTHGLNVSLYGGLIARWLDLTEPQIKEVIQAGALHDIGKAQIPLEILNKKGPLTTEEMAHMKNHSVYGYKMVKDNQAISGPVKEAVLMHHERENGSGYPLGVTGECLHIYTKIISVADVYDALTSERVYKKRVTPFDTFLEFEELGFEHFDPRVILAFLKNIANYYTGAKVKMNDGKEGEIVCILPQSISTPLVIVEGQIVDLSLENNYKIVEML